MRSIRGRLLALLLAGLAVVLVAGGAAVYWIADAGFVGQLDASLKARALTVASLVKFEPGRLVFESGDAAADPISETYFELRTLDGDVLKRSDNLGDTALPDHDAPTLGEPVFENIDLPAVTKSPSETIHARVVLFSFRPRMDEDDWAGVPEDERVGPETLVVAAALDRGPVDRTLGTLLTALLFAGAMVAVTAVVLIMVGVGWGLAPLNRLSGQLGAVSGESISTRIDSAAAPRELAPIYRELNGMLDRVERTIERERSFADAAAHELRTPLAELRAMAEVAIRWPDPERAASALGEVLSIGEEMEHLVESLLLISRGHAKAAGDATDRSPVRPIVHECLQRASGSICEKQLNVTVTLDDRRTLRAPRDAVEIIMRNLIGNAVEYTPSHGVISIRDERADNGVAGLIVENGPVGLSEGDLPRLFEPFWRMERSRTDRRHVGLGLAVVEQVARAIGLRIEAGLLEDRLQIRVHGAVSVPGAA